jgi:hypothetical protein
MIIGYAKYDDYILTIQTNNCTSMGNLKIYCDTLPDDIISTTRFCTTSYKVIEIEDLLGNKYDNINDILKNKYKYYNDNDDNNNKFIVGNYYNNDDIHIEFFLIKKLAFDDRFIEKEQWKIFNNYEGVYRSYFYNGNISDEYYHRNGIIQGKRIKYWYNGTIMEESNYINGTLI